MEKLVILLKEKIFFVITATIAATGSLVCFAMYQTYAEPIALRFVTTTVTDSLSIWNKRAKEKHPSGFRYGVSVLTDIKSSDVTDSIAVIMNNEKNVYATLTLLMDEHRYQVEFNTVVFLMCTEHFVYNGVRMRKTKAPEGELFDVYYKDQFDKWQKASYYRDTDEYYFKPNYSDGQKILCD